jgi:hypothetical protein
MRKNLYKVLLTLNIVLFGFGINVLSQEKEVTLKDKKITINRENESLGTIFRDLIELYDVPIGFEESIFDRGNEDYLFETNILYKKNCSQVSDKTCGSIKQRLFISKNHKFSIHVENESLENVLNQIVSNMKYYKWEINEEVVNIVPIIGRDKRLEDFLKVEIKSFANVDGLGRPSKTIAYISSSIVFTPEINNFLKNNNIYLTNGAYQSLNNGRNLSDNLVLSNLTLRELLNKITKYKRGGWALRKYQLNQLKDYEIFEIDV